MLAVVGGKGGCGKTTTTLCLARALARREGGTIAVDADVDMPDLHTVAGTAGEPSLEAVGDERPLAAARHRSVTFPGVDVLPAPSNSRTLSRVADRLHACREPVLVDTAAGVSPDVTRALRIADRSIVVSTPTRESLADAAKSAELARAVDAPPIGTVVSRSDGTVDPEPLLDCPTIAHVPSVTDPCRDQRVRKTYTRCVSIATKRNV